ncbi:MAG: DEAD/DEAH box helicase [Ignavibacteria bacterium]|nr:DEAD/DEAH box helicase [Ignavibacteria bacterium]
MFKRILRIIGIGKEEKEESIKPVKTETSETPVLKVEKPAPEKVKENKKPVYSPRKTQTKTEKPEPGWDISQYKVENAEGKKRFHDFDLPLNIIHAISDLGYKYCTPIQAELLTDTLNGKDAFGQAQTGTGKTAAFLISILTRIIKNKLQQKPKPGTPRALILAPTRELVIQIAKEASVLSKYAKIKIISVYGGMHYKKQKSLLENEIFDIVVATPGRLLDFCKTKVIHLNKVEILVLDEADRMLDMGFIPDVREIIKKTPQRGTRQTLFFSATISDRVKRLAHSWTNNPSFVSIDPEQVTVDSVEQYFYLVERSEKMLIIANLIKSRNIQKSIVFCNRKDETRVVGDYLNKAGIKCEILSGDVEQRKRLATLEKFKNEDIRILVATDIAGRGIHVDNVKYVFNYSLPDDPEDYVHRIGRTGRAGEKGISVSLAGEDDSFAIPAIEKFTGKKFDYQYPPDELLVKS